jgi:hypothetical protein
MKSNIFWIMGSLLFLFTIVIADDNDEECLLCDAMVGAAVAVSYRINRSITRFDDEPKLDGNMLNDIFI